MFQSTYIKAAYRALPSGTGGPRAANIHIRDTRNLTAYVV